MRKLDYSMLKNAGVIATLKQLKQLHDEGTLNEEDYFRMRMVNRKKKKKKKVCTASLTLFLHFRRLSSIHMSPKQLPEHLLTPSKQTHRESFPQPTHVPQQRFDYDQEDIQPPEPRALPLPSAKIHRLHPMALQDSSEQHQRLKRAQ